MQSTKSQADLISIDFPFFNIKNIAQTKNIYFVT